MSALPSFLSRAFEWSVGVGIVLLLANTCSPESFGSRHGVVVRAYNTAVWQWQASDPVARSAEAARADDWNGAIAILDAALAEHPDNAELLYQKAGAYVGLDQPLMAAIYFRAYMEAVERGGEFFDWSRTREQVAWLTVTHAAEIARMQAIAIRTTIIDLSNAIPRSMQQRESFTALEALTDPPSAARGGSSAFDADYFGVLEGVSALCTAVHENCRWPMDYTPWLDMLREARLRVTYSKPVDGRPCCGVALSDPVLSDLDAAIDEAAALPPYEQPRAFYRIFSKLAFAHNLLLQNNNPIGGATRNMIPSFEGDRVVWSAHLKVQERTPATAD